MESFFAGRQFVGVKLARINKCLSMPEIVARLEKECAPAFAKAPARQASIGK
jgi:hypothetical protein